MDQDLSLMKQLLTLNEAIQDLKAGRSLGNSKDSVDSSRDLMSESDWSVSETDMYGSDNEDSSKKNVGSLIDSPVHGVNNLSQIGYSDMEDSGCSDSSKLSNLDQYSPRNLRKISEKLSKAQDEVQSKSRIVSHSAQGSIDSGYSYVIYRKDIETTI